jgi:hypothetical protein
MNVTSLQEIRLELPELPAKELAALCLSLAKYKKDNKEYLGYLLFHSQNREGFIAEVKNETDVLFSEIDQKKNVYFIKKSLRKILMVLNKYGKYVGEKATTADLLLYYCRKIKDSGISIHKSPALEKIFYSQIKKIKTLTSSLHEDLQGDYKNELESLISN